jgi:hypothetical protein
MGKDNKILYNLLGLASLVTFGYASYELFKLYKKGKQGADEKSSADGLKTITFTLTNNTSQNQTEYMFDSRSGKDNSNVGVSPSMGFFNRELSNKPKKLMKIEFRNVSSNFSNVTALPSDGTGTGDITIGGGGAVGTAPLSPTVVPPIVDPSTPPMTTPSPNQAEAPFKMICADASGNSSTQQYTPLISANQFQGGITSVKFNGKILDGECYMAYTMFPKSKVTMVIYYKDLPSPLDKKKRKKRTRKGKKENRMERTQFKTQTDGILAGMGI